MAVVGAAFLLPAQTARAQEWQFQAEPAAVYESNVSHGLGPDVLDDEILVLAMSAGPAFALSGRDLLTAGIDLKGSHNLRFGRLDSVDAGASLGLRHKLGVGLLAPWISISADWQRRDYYRSRLRRGYSGDFRVIWGRRLSERLDAALGAAYDWRIAGAGEPEDPGLPGTAFNLRGVGAFAKAGYQFDRHLRLGARMDYRHGDVVAETRSEDANYSKVRAAAVDPAFGDEFYAYRLPGTTAGATVSLDCALDAHSSLGVHATANRTFASGGSHYDDGLLSLSYLYRF